MNFVHPSLVYAWLLPMACVPVLIHLINLMRHRRIRWATMEFLLESQKRNRNWIRLKQWLLLLVRVVAMSAIVLMLAGPLLSDSWSRLFGGGQTHHVVLVDDSLSMTDHWDNTNAMEVARGVIENLAQRAGRQGSQQSLSLLRFSDAAAGRGPELLRAPLRGELPPPIASLADVLKPTQLAVGPLEALEAVKSNKIARRPDEQLVVYLISDFRSPQWRDTAALRQAIGGLTDSHVKVQFIRCVDRARPNLAISGLAPAAGIIAAGAPVNLDLDVTNFGTDTVRNVQVLLESQTNSLDGTGPGSRQALPAVNFDRIEPGKSARQSFPVLFSTAGDHEIFARLPSDAIEADNQRFCVIHVPADVPVLIVDGQPGSLDATILRIALSPLQRVRTGIRPQIETVAYLREQPLDKFSVIYLVNIGRLDPDEVAALDAYVSAGGGVVFFTGEATRPDFVNESLYRHGKGMFPLPLVSQASLISDRLDKVPDVEVDYTHPIFSRTFAGLRNSFLARILIDRYFATDKDWAPTPKSDTRVLAWLRNRAPLIVEHRHGRGIFLAVLTTAAPVWNNWAPAGPTFTLTMLETQVYASAGKMPQLPDQVGQPLNVELDKNQYAPEVKFTRPADKLSVSELVNVVPVGSNTDHLKATLSKTLESGVYEARLLRTDHTPEIRRFALNVPTSEGDLKLVSNDELHTLLGDLPVTIHEAREFSGNVTDQAGVNLGNHWLFLVSLVGLLAVEQLLAYSASYHPPTQGGRK